jgi:hypothetical protein
MAIAPNTTFTSGAILTAAQMNALPYGIVALQDVTASSGNVSVETLRVTSTAFTAIANRYYEVTYFEPRFIFASGTVTAVGMNIRLTNLAGSLLQSSYVYMNSAANGGGICSYVTTFTAGSTVLVGTFSPAGGGSASAQASSTQRGYILVKDLGPA